MITLTTTKKLFLETNEDDYVYKNLDEFYQTLIYLTKTSEELTKTYFSHYNE